VITSDYKSNTLLDLPIARCLPRCTILGSVKIDAYTALHAYGKSVKIDAYTALHAYGKSVKIDAYTALHAYGKSVKIDAYTALHLYGKSVRCCLQLVRNLLPGREWLSLQQGR
jgi:hypothetical protein